MFGSYLVRHWRGELTLVRAFWVNGLLALLLPMLFAAPFLHPPMALLGQPGALRVAAGLWIVLTALRSVVQVWSNVGIWRSATHHVQRGGQRLRASLAKLFATTVTVLQIGGAVHVSWASDYALFFRSTRGICRSHPRLAWPGSLVSE